jgi:hypothetical protein
VVARKLLIVSQRNRRDMNDRVEPENCANCLPRSLHPDVSTEEVHEFMVDDAFALKCVESILEIFRKIDGRPEETGYERCAR